MTVTVRQLIDALRHLPDDLEVHLRVGGELRPLTAIQASDRSVPGEGRELDPVVLADAAPCPLHSGAALR